MGQKYCCEQSFTIISNLAGGCYGKQKPEPEQESESEQQSEQKRKQKSEQQKSEQQKSEQQSEQKRKQKPVLIVKSRLMAAFYQCVKKH